MPVGSFVAENMVVGEFWKEEVTFVRLLLCDVLS